MKKTLIVLVCVFAIVGYCLVAEGEFFDTKAGAKKGCEEFMEKIAVGDIEKAFDTIRPYFPIPESEFSTLKMQTIKQRGLIGPRFGESLGCELIKEEAVNEVIVRYTFIEKFEIHVLRWVFTLYKPNDKWLINSLVWDDEIDAFFR